MNALHYATLGGHLSIVQYFAEKTAIDVNSVDYVSFHVIKFSAIDVMKRINATLYLARKAFPDARSRKRRFVNRRVSSGEDVG